MTPTEGILIGSWPMSRKRAFESVPSFSTSIQPISCSSSRACSVHRVRVDDSCFDKFVQAFMSPDEAFVLRLLEALDSAGLEGLIVGMTGAALQGAPAMTQDVDLLIRDTPKNREKLRKRCDGRRRSLNLSRERAS